MSIKAPKGTKDVLPFESYKWQYIEGKIRNICDTYGYHEIRTPVFEHTELFQRGVGDTTDIVQKEMYTFLDKGDRSITLKPEGTAGAARAFIENRLYAGVQPTKMFYFTPVFRYENPQAGRLREHHQFGVEVFGGPEASVDAEIITLALSLFDSLGIQGLELNINSIGCSKCRPTYNEALKGFLSHRLDDLCGTCKQRFERNPLRILDCKVDQCKKTVQDAPVMIDYLCDDCKNHFENLKSFLDSVNIQYQINPFIVRGLDYYTKTVFEIISNQIGSQGTVCGGGRYDKLVEECGGPSTAGVGFGMGLERLLMVLENQGIIIPNPSIFDVYVCTLGDLAKIKGFALVNELRKNKIKAECDHTGRSLKAQLKYADKLNVKWVVILGDDEIKQNAVKLRNMKTGNEELVSFNNIIQYIHNM